MIVMAVNIIEINESEKGWRDVWLRWLTLAGSVFLLITASLLITFQGIEFWKAFIQLLNDYFNHKT
jgi:hypothetical protein